MTFFDKLEPWFLETRRDLPWRINRTPYRVWLSEIMLQQTQVITVIDYYERFTAKFPTVQALAAAPEDDILALWSGLGYYSRARNLHKTSKIITEEYAGVFPDDYQALQKFPGIGSYTAGAILAFAFSKAAPVVDGNIARVLSRLLNDPGDKKHFESISLELAQKAPDVLLWQEGLMELGALVCTPTQPACHACPFGSVCLARQHGTIEQLPVKQAKPEKTRLDIICALVHNDEHIWLQKNQGNGLFKGLYAPPNLVTTPENKIQDFKQLLSAHKLWPPPSEKFLTVQRTLTHRNLHLHAKIISMPSALIPNEYQIKKSELSKIGLSAAVKNLLSKAALLSLLLTTISCSHKNASIRYVPRIPEAPKRLDPVSYAQNLIGQPYATLDGKKYRPDCSGTVKAIYDAAGLSLGKVEGTEAIYEYIKKNGQLDMKQAQKGDLVFFNAGDKKQLAHIGFIEEIFPDNTILFIHHMSGMIIRSRMNIKSPNLQIDPRNQTRLNHILRRANQKKGYTAGQLFAGFGRLK
jgi:A/G-specific adenine glycosylase